jgi:hypothetical protein
MNFMMNPPRGSPVYHTPARLRLRTRLFYDNASMIEQPEKEREFFPRGAIAFFSAMLVFFSAIWLLFYALMIHRH